MLRQGRRVLIRGETVNALHYNHAKTMSSYWSQRGGSGGGSLWGRSGDDDDDDDHDGADEADEANEDDEVPARRRGRERATGRPLTPRHAQRLRTAGRTDAMAQQGLGDLCGRLLRGHAHGHGGRRQGAPGRAPLRVGGAAGQDHLERL